MTKYKDTIVELLTQIADKQPKETNSIDNFTESLATLSQKIDSLSRKVDQNVEFLGNIFSEIESLSAKIDDFPIKIEPQNTPIAPSPAYNPPVEKFTTVQPSPPIAVPTSVSASMEPTSDYNPLSGQIMDNKLMNHKPI